MGRFSTPNIRINMKGIKKKKAAAAKKTADAKTVSDRIQSKKDRSDDIDEGRKFGKDILGEDGLGRMGEDQTLIGMEEQAAGFAKGFSSEEMLAKREKGIEGIQGATSAQSRAMQASLARSGVKGQAAGDQLGQIAQSGIEARGNMERDLLIEQRGAQMEGLKLQSDIHGQTSANKRFDLGQAAKEKNIELQTGLGFAQMGSTERAAALNREAQIKSARAGRQRSCFIEGTKIRMADDSLKNIEDIQLADFVGEGGVVYMINKSLASEIYDYKGVKITGRHAVLENGRWVRVEDSKYAIKEEGIFPVYNLSNELHRIITDCGTEFADYDETDLGSEITDKESLEVLNGKGSEVLEGRGRV